MKEDAQLTSAYVRRQTSRMHGRENDSESKATLANLRRGIGKPPGSMPELWEITLEGLPETLISRDGNPTKAEWAVHTALTLFALHQQGKNPKIECMDRAGASLGTSVGSLVKEKDFLRIKRRFDAAATSDSLAEFSHHLRGLIQLMRDKAIPLDYAGLASDLYFYQSRDARDSVRLRWGRDFYQQIHKGRKLKNKENNERDGDPNE